MNNGYYCIGLSKNNKSTKKLLHRLIYEVYNGTIPKKMEIDHIDNNKLNNHISNLRLATHSENNCNVNVRIDNKIGYKNIYYNTKRKDYYVRISKNGKYVYKKYFKTLEEAIENRDIQLLLIHGDFCNLG